MGVVSRLGKWLDSRFPERISVEEVVKSLTAYSQLDTKLSILEASLRLVEQRLKSFENGAHAFDVEISGLKDEMNKAKVVIAMTQKLNQRPVLNTSEPWKR